MGATCISVDTNLKSKENLDKRVAPATQLKIKLSYRGISTVSIQK
jgi:hypothetical protein